MKSPLHESIERFGMPPVEVTEEILEVCRVNDQFGDLAYALHKEALILVNNCSLLNFGNTIKWKRNQAICAGLLIRICKYMFSVTVLSADMGHDMGHDATIQALSRCITESAVNLRYLLLKGDDTGKGGVTGYDTFVLSSLAPERELYHIIQENIESTDSNPLVIEHNMLNSIEKTCELSGLTVEEINPKAGNWGGSFRDKLAALGYDWQAYTALQRMSSHAIHGDWVDMLANHLRPEGDGFKPNYNKRNTDGKYFIAIDIFGVEAARSYLDKWFDLPDAERLSQRLDSVLERLRRVDSARPDWQTVPSGTTPPLPHRPGT